MLGQGWRKVKGTFDKTRQPYQKPTELCFIIKPNGILLYEWFITQWKWLARAKTKSPNIIINWFSLQIVCGDDIDKHIKPSNCANPMIKRNILI